MKKPQLTPLQQSFLLQVMRHYVTRPASLRNQSLGQWLCNAFSVADNEIFFNDDDNRTRALIATRYETYDPIHLERYNRDYA